MNRYQYEGPVMSFEHCIASRWKGETLAPSEAKARSNLVYQYKKKHNHSVESNIKLPGKIRLIS